MSVANNSGDMEYPFDKRTVFDALLRAIPKVDGMSVHSSDCLSGRVVAKAGMSLASWGENIPITLIEPAANRTLVQISSTPKTGVSTGGFMDSGGFFTSGDLTFGKNRKNVERILSALSSELSKIRPTAEPKKKKCPFLCGTYSTRGNQMSILRKRPPRTAADGGTRWPHPESNNRHSSL